jgi:hypothetical protein
MANVVRFVRGGVGPTCHWTSRSHGGVLVSSFRLNPNAKTHPPARLVASVAGGGLASTVGFRCWVLVTLDRGWHLERDPFPYHWTRSAVWTFAFGCGVGLALGVLQFLWSRRRNRRKARIGSNV